MAGVAREINNPLAAVMAGRGLTLEASRELRKRLRDRTLLDPETEIRQLDEGIEALEDAWEGGQRIAGIVKESGGDRPPRARRESGSGSPTSRPRRSAGFVRSWMPTSPS